MVYSTSSMVSIFGKPRLYSKQVCQSKMCPLYVTISSSGLFYFYFLLHVCVSRAEDACIELKKAIEAGDMQSASVLAASLARRQVALKIQLSTKSYEETEIK